MSAFQFGLVTDPALLALRDPSHPDFKKLVKDPFYTVNAQTKAQKRGQKVFEKKCLSCHNTPNVFNNLDNVEPLGPNHLRPVDFPVWAPSVGRTFNIGISERNKHNLRFTVQTDDGFETVVLPLAKGDGTLVNLPVTFDVGLAATTGRYEDVGRFKVPQLRDVKNNAPYFHDNSAMTLEEVVEYFDSAAYNNSRDGKRYPIHMNWKQKKDLVEFLKIL
jgi:cytochrome c peroxidase